MEVGLVQRVDIEDKMRSAYLSYAMSVITSRALPDVRDGLKPVQRRILYAMHDMGLTPDRPTRKSARIVGEVLGKYHPHGDSAVYDAMVRMAQEFSMRYPLVDGQGNFGSIDGDTAAAMRYTEARLTALGEELLLDIDKNTVNFVDNFDGSLQEPEVLPAKLPNLLINGVGGIAVGMATNIPPHNLGEIVNALVFLIDHAIESDAVVEDQPLTMDDITVDDLMRYVHGPDFPTGGIILGREGIRQAYATGKGRVITRSRVHVEELRGGHTALIVTELPYQVNKSTLVERIATLVRDERVQGIADLRDESDRTGMRIVIELKRSQDPEPVLADLLKYTQMQNTFGVNMLALVDGEPRLLSLKRVLLHHIEHRHDVIVRRTEFDLERARARAHILEGLLLALDNLDEVISTIRRSQTADTARTNLIRKFKMSEIQAQAVLDMQLRRLASLERKRIQEEYAQLQERIAYLEGLLQSKVKILGLIKDDLLELKEKFGDPRRTTITDLDGQGKYCTENLVPEEDLLIVVTRNGSVRRLPASADSGRSTAPAMSARERDTVLAAFEVTSQERVVFFTERGRAFSLPAHQLPDASQQAEGQPVTALAHLEDDERVVDVAHLAACEPGYYVTMATREGKVKRLELTELESVSRQPTEVLGLADGDQLVRALVSHGGGELVVVTAQGKAIRFAEDEVSVQGRSAMGVKGVTLQDDHDAVVDMDLVREDGHLVVLTALGYAKRTPLKEYSAQGRGGQGAYTVDNAKLDDTGLVTAGRVVAPKEEVAFCTKNGTMASRSFGDIPARDRATWGRLVTRSRRSAVVAVAESDQAVGVVVLESRSDGGGRGAVPGGNGDTPSTSETSSPAPTASAKRGRRSSRTRSGSTRRSTRTSAKRGQETTDDGESKATGVEPMAPSRRRSTSRRSHSTGAAKPAASSEAPAKEETPEESKAASRSRRTGGTASRTSTSRTRRTTTRKPPSRSRRPSSTKDEE